MIIGEYTICGKEISKLTPGSEKRILVSCDLCKKHYEIIFHNYTESQKRKGNTGITHCKTCAHSITGKANKGRPCKMKGISKPEYQGPLSKSWKGGTYISSDGYRMVQSGIRDPSIKWKNYQKEHILVMESYLQRKMLPGEIIHHIDGDKLNNRIENLFVFSSDREHREAHIQLERLAMSIVQAGLITFDTSRQIYVADIKLRELLEHPGEDNQQPSLEGDFLEGSTTRSYDLF